MEMMMDMKSMTLEELTEDMAVMGEKAYRAKQLYQWMHVKLATGFDEMTNLSLSFRETCKERYTYTSLRCVSVQESAADGTKKYLFELPDRQVIESVFMRYKHGNSVCISSQAGCRMGCVFCASAIGGLCRNLTPSEMLEQVYAISRETGERVSHVVVMGTGEPLDNYDNLLRFIRLLTDENGLHISQRNITVSTCGLVPEVKKLAEEKLQVTLAVSLHAATDEKRKKLMPIAKTYALKELKEACQFYYSRTGRRLTLEYSLIGGINDREEDLKSLSSFARSLNCHVNLIPLNPVKERHLAQSKKSDILRFKNGLEKNGINVTIRREMGRDIDGACGQLRHKYAGKPLQ